MSSRTVHSRRNGSQAASFSSMRADEPVSERFSLQCAHSSDICIQTGSRTREVIPSHNITNKGRNILFTELAILLSTQRIFRVVHGHFGFTLFCRQWMLIGLESTSL